MMFLKPPPPPLSSSLLLFFFNIYLYCQNPVATLYMSNKSCGSDDDDKDLEALQGSPSCLTDAAHDPHRRWRSIFLMLQAHQILISILGDDPSNSLPHFEIASAPSYAVLSSTSDGDDYEVCFSFHMK